MELLAKAAFAFSGIPGEHLPQAGATIPGRRGWPSPPLENGGRVPQPPKMRKTFGGPKGKSDFERKKWQINFP
jgi:hypothetical protein